MIGEQVGDEFVPFPLLHLAHPAREGVLAVQAGEAIELRLQVLRIAEEMTVLPHQEGDALGQRRLDQHAAARAHARKQRIGHLQLADFLALRFHIYGFVRIELAQGVPHQAVEHFLRRLCLLGQVAEHRAAVAGQVLQIERLRAGRGQRLQQAALGAAGGAADHAVAELLRQFGQLRQDLAPVGAIAALELRRVPADFGEDVRHGAASLAAAPAVDQRTPVPAVRGEVFLDVAGNVFRHQRRAALFRIERRDLLIHGADRGALGVVEHRAVDCAGHVVPGKFGGRTHVDDLVKLGQLCYGYDVRKFHDVSNEPLRIRMRLLDNQPRAYTQTPHSNGVPPR